MLTLGPYLPFQDYIVRVPFLPTNLTHRLSTAIIRQLCQTKAVSEAIYIASPELHKEMEKYLKGEKIKNVQKLENALSKYLLRMSHRCTPFGLFSGYAIGKIGEQTNIALQHHTAYTRQTRLDMNYLCSLVQQLEKDMQLRETLHYFPNTSLYKIGEHFRYVEYRYIKNERKHFTVSIDVSEYLLRILDKATTGATVHTLANSIVEDDITLEIATEFIHDLIDNQILISEISPTVSGEDYLENITTQLASSTYQQWLSQIQNKLAELDRHIHQNNIENYNELIDLLAQFNAAANKKHLFQTDLFINCEENQLANTTVKDIIQGIKILNQLTPLRKNDRLEKFKKAFYEKYETEAIPLSVALDVETGIGYGILNSDFHDISPLTDDLILFSDSKDDDKKITRTRTDELLHHKFLEAHKTQSKIIEITDKDVKELTINWDDLPHTFSVMANIFSKDQDAPLIHLDYVGGTSAAALLGRFSYMNDKINTLVQNIVEKEKREGVIFAEIVHLPEARTGNILHRPHLREFEIPYLAKSTLPPDQQLPLNDLYISVEYDRIILKSKRHNKEVIPRLSNAHNFSFNSLPIYHFLCDIQTQGLRAHLTISWENVLPFQHFIPRVSYKNIIFRLAEWRVVKDEITTLSNIDSFKEWIKKRELPQQVLLADGDNELLIDTENELSIQLFLSIIKNRDLVILKEYLFDQDNALVKHHDQSFTNEVLFSFYKPTLN